MTNWRRSWVIPVLARLAFWSVASTVENNSSVDNVALAALVVSGHKAINSRFLEQSACAALTMINSARTLGNFDGDAVIMMGPLGANSPHDLASWRSAQKGWIAQHDAHARQLAALLDSTKSQTRTIDLVPLLLSNAYPFMKRNLNYMKLAVYTLDRYDKVVFVDLDIIIVRPLSDILALSTESVELVGYRTCTAPVNSGFFIVRPRGVNGRRRLQHLNDITLRNKCPCRSAKEPFASSGFDNWGEIAQDLVSLWTKGTHASPSQPGILLVLARAKDSCGFTLLLKLILTYLLLMQTCRLSTIMPPVQSHGQPMLKRFPLTSKTAKIATLYGGQVSLVPRQSSQGLLLVLVSISSCPISK